VRDGILVDYQATRDEAHILGRDASHGCSYADSWSSVQFQRMANVSLAPGAAAQRRGHDQGRGERHLHPRPRSYSIDQQRYNAQFGGQLYYQIKDGKIAGMVEDAAYQIRTPEFWNACTAICDERDFRLGGSFFDGKGQPGQVSAVSHGSSTTRFNGINIINTARSLGA
jgi:TldD protein